MIVWIVNPFDPIPGENERMVRYGPLSIELIRRGHEVIWWSSNFSHLEKSYRDANRLEKIDKLNIRLLPVPPYQKNIGIKRIFNHLVFALQFKMRANKEKKIPDIIIASFPPIMSALFAMDFAAENKIPGIIDVQDLWPESFKSAIPRCIMPLEKYLLCPVERLSYNAFKKATVVTAVSETYMKKKAVAAEQFNIGIGLGFQGYFPLGIDPSDFEFDTAKAKPIIEKGEDKIWIIRAGVVGKFSDTDLILNAADHYRNRAGIKFIIAGGGPMVQHVQKKIQTMALSNVICTGFIDSTQFVLLQKLSDIGLCTYSKDSIHSQVNKAFNYMAAGLPILNSITGEMAQIIEKESIGLNYQAGSVDSFLMALNELISNEEKRKQMGDRALRLAKTKYNKKIIYRTYSDFLENVAQGHSNEIS